MFAYESCHTAELVALWARLKRTAPNHELSRVKWWCLHHSQDHVEKGCPRGIPARATHKFRSFFRASKEGGYEAVRTLLEELKRKSPPISFTLNVTLGQTTITTTNNISIDSLLTRARGTQKPKAGVRNSHQHIPAFAIGFSNSRLKTHDSSFRDSNRLPNPHISLSCTTSADLIS
jgi:hypothetical protein